MSAYSIPCPPKKFHVNYYCLGVVFYREESMGNLDKLSHMYIFNLLVWKFHDVGAASSPKFILKSVTLMKEYHTY